MARSGYTTIRKNQDIRLRGTDQQQTTRRTRNLLYEGPTFGRGWMQGEVQGPVGNQLAADSRPEWIAIEEPSKGLEIDAFRVHNRSGASTQVGVGFRYNNSLWEMGALDASQTDPADYVLDRSFQSRNAVTLAIAANDGFIVASRKPFDWLSVNVTTASADAAATTSASLDYSDEAGNAWIALSSGQAYVDDFNLSSQELTTGEKLLVWTPPHDWGKVVRPNQLAASSADMIIPADHYALRFIWDTVPDTTAPIVTGVEIGSLYRVRELGDDEIWSETDLDWFDFDADGVVSYFGTAAAGNNVTIKARPRG